MILILLVMGGPFSYGSDSEPAPIEMKLGHFAADSHPGNLASKMFAEGVEKRTNGNIKVIIYPNNALGSPPEVLEQNILGAVDMSLPTQGQLGKYSKKFNCVMLPFMYNNYEHADKVLDGKFLPWAVPDLDKAGLVFLSNWEGGFRNLTNTKRTGHNYNTMVHVISKKVWDKLTPEQKTIVKEESKKAGDWMRRTLRNEEADQINQLKKFGMEITYPDKTEFKKLMKPAYDRMKAIAGEENIAAFIKMVDEAK